jgi:ketosteroid isomerase-like protein
MQRNLEYLLEKNALEEALIRYCTAVDKLADLDFMLGNFTEDAVLDLSGLHLPKFVGHAAIRGFFAQVFEDMSHHAHLMTNFRVESLHAQRAEVTAYITGMGRSKAGIDILVYVRYDLVFRKVAGTWKISEFSEAPILPMPQSVLDVHRKQ